MRQTTHFLKQGFTLVEMMVIAPIVILLIGAFIALIVNLTGEVMSSRGANVLAYDVQDALNRIEADVKLSTTFLATNNIDVSSTKQGYSANPSPNGGTANFTNINKSASGGSYQSIILNSLATDGNPVSLSTGLVYLANAPNTCDDYVEYSKNTPMTMNIVYFVDNTNTLWRRTIMPTNYNDSSAYCGPNEPWQVPSCIKGYNTSALTFCKTTDEKLISGVSPDDFNFSYYSSASSTVADAIATNTTASDDARSTALQSTPTLSVSITARQSIAGRDLTRTGTLRVTRLDTNASSIAKTIPVTAAPAAPILSGNVSDGHNVTFTWPRVSDATTYKLEYRINGGSWQLGADDLDNNTRSYVVTDGTHTDTVEARVQAINSFGPSSYGTSSITIPLWAPLILKGNWTAYSSTYAPASYTKTKSGMVIIKGMVKNGGTPVLWETIGSLPNDYKPSGRLIFGTTTSSNVPARVNITPTDDGANIEFGSGGSPAWFSLDTIRYVADSAGYTRNTLSLQNGYTNYGGDYSPATWTQDSVGRITIEGLLTGGTRTSGTTIAALPSAATPPLTSLVPSWANGSYSDFGVQASPSAIIARGGAASGWYSINTSYLPSSASVTWNNLSFTNSWANYGGSYATGQYAKTSDGVVQLKGLIKNGSNTYDTTIATLPAGFRPKERLLFTTMQNSDAWSRLDILPDGQVRYMGSNNGYYNLSGIMFVAEQ